MAPCGVLQPCQSPPASISAPFAVATAPRGAPGTAASVPLIPGMGTAVTPVTAATGTATGTVMGTVTVPVQTPGAGGCEGAFASAVWLGKVIF